MKGVKLTTKQKRFCQEYVVDSNGKQAAIRVGYSKKTAENQASRLLSNAKVQEEVKRLNLEKAKRNQITIDECVTLLANQARFDISQCLNEDGTIKPINEIPIEHRQSLQGLDVFEVNSSTGELIGVNKKIKLADRNTAIEKLMKHLGGFENHNNQKKGGIDLSKLDTETLIKLRNASS